MQRIQINTEKHTHPLQSTAPVDQCYFGLFYFCYLAVWVIQRRGTAWLSYFLKGLELFRFVYTVMFSLWPVGFSGPDKRGGGGLRMCTKRLIWYWDVFLGNEVSIQAAGGKQTYSGKCTPCVASLTGNKDTIWSGGQVDEGGCGWVVTFPPPVPSLHVLAKVCWGRVQVGLKPFISMARSDLNFQGNEQKLLSYLFLSP